MPTRTLSFPSPWRAPRALLELPGGCGPVSAWMVLRRFGRRVPAGRLAPACRYTAEDGTFTIGLAVGLRELGLTVRFHSEPDPDRRPLEEECYALAARIGVGVHGPLELPELLARVGGGEAAIVFYDADGTDAHFSPLAGSRGGRLLLPNDPDRGMDAERFEARWRQPGILRQCVLASAGPPGPEP